MKVFFKGTVAAFAALVAAFVREGVTFEVKWLTEPEGGEGQAELVFTGGY